MILATAENIKDLARMKSLRGLAGYWPKFTPEQSLTELKQECEKIDSSDKPEECSYLLPTERVRLRIMANLWMQKEIALPIVRNEEEKAQGKYQEMLAICLAALGDTGGIAESVNLLLNAKSPTVRLCAAHSLRNANSMKVIRALKQALQDPYMREDRRPENKRAEMCYPVRIAAGEILLAMGIHETENQQ